MITRLAMVAALALGVAGCSTPEVRIVEVRDTYDSLGPWLGIMEVEEPGDIRDSISSNPQLREWNWSIQQDLRDLIE